MKACRQCILDKHHMNEPLGKHKMLKILILQSKNTQKVQCNLKKLLIWENVEGHDVKTEG